MPSPFPGMDPFIEGSGAWRTFHHMAITEIGTQIGRTLPDGYMMLIEEHTYFAGDNPTVKQWIAPNISISRIAEAARRYDVMSSLSAPVRVTLPHVLLDKDHYIAIRKQASDELVTVVEVLSPTNKESGPGLAAYLAKRERVLQSNANLVEIDLLRGGTRIPLATDVGDFDYSVLIKRAADYQEADLIRWVVRDPLIRFAIPLGGSSPEPLIELSAVVAEAYDRALLSRRIDYRAHPLPPLSQGDEEWADGLLREKGLRG